MNKDIAKDIGNIIRKYRRAHGLTQKELAEKINISQGAVSRYERGKSNLPLSVLIDISDVCEFSPREYIWAFIGNDDIVYVVRKLQEMGWIIEKPSEEKVYLEFKTAYKERYADTKVPDLKKITERTRNFFSILREMMDNYGEVDVLPIMIRAAMDMIARDLGVSDNQLPHVLGMLDSIHDQR